MTFSQDHSVCGGVGGCVYTCACTWNYSEVMRMLVELTKFFAFKTIYDQDPWRGISIGLLKVMNEIWKCRF